MAWHCPICESVVGRGKVTTAKCCRKCGAVFVCARRLVAIRQVEVAAGGMSDGERRWRIGDDDE